MGWEDLVELARDPLVTIASATVNYPILANLKDTAALREMTMGRAVMKAALGHDPLHFAYPFGTRGSFGRQQPLLAAEAGFASAVTAAARGGVAKGAIEPARAAALSAGMTGGVRCA